MALSDYVSLTISQTTANVTRAGFGVAMLLSATVAWAERTRTYTDLTSFAVDFPVTTSGEYLAAQAYFGQSPCPTKLIVGRSANKPTQVYQLTALNPTTNISYTYQVRVAGSGFAEQIVSFTSDATPTDAEYAAGMVAALNAVVGKNYTAAGAASPVTITANAAGNWFSVEVLDINYQKVTQTHVDPGVAADLTAINAENSTWYSLITLYNSKLYSIAAAAWVEANGKIYVPDSNDSTTLTTATGNGDLMDQCKTNAYTRTAVHYHPSPKNMMSAAINGKCLPLEPGSETWKFKTLAGVAAFALSATARGNITSRNGNSYETVAGVNLTFDGKTGDGNYIDVRRGLDWLTDDMQKSVFGALAGASKIAYTDPGIAVIESQIRGSLKRAVDKGILTNSPAPTVIVPTAASVSALDKSARTLNGVRFTGTLQGAVHSANIIGVVST